MLYWDQFVDNSSGKWSAKGGLPPGEALAALRAGLGRPALTVPKMWQYYTTNGGEHAEIFGTSAPAQDAEHAALALFGLHQQSQRTLMHERGIGMGTALLRLRQAGVRSADAVDRSVGALVTSTSVAAVCARLRGLVPQLRSIGQPLDYTMLMRDLERWKWPDGRQRTIRSWAQGYQRWEGTPAAQQT